MACLFRGDGAIVLAFDLAEVDDEVRPGVVCLGARTPFMVDNGEEACLLYDDDS